jgi:chorismate dehydratase
VNNHAEDRDGSKLPQVLDPDAFDSGNKRLRIAAIRFLNPAPLMWDFEHEPHQSELADRYQIRWMTPAACADRLALPINDPQAADIGLVPVAALATTSGLRIVPGCAIAAKRKVRSILLVRRASQPLAEIKTVAADTSSKASLAYTQILFKLWGNQDVAFLPHRPDLDPMLDVADAAMLIGDPALFALEERQNRSERTGEELVYHDLAEEWIALTHVPWVSAVWAIREASLQRTGLTMETIAADLNASKEHGLANIDSLVLEWSRKLPLSTETIHEYLTSNIYYHLDQQCLEGLRKFYEMAGKMGILPPYSI